MRPGLLSESQSLQLLLFQAQRPRLPGDGGTWFPNVGGSLRWAGTPPGISHQTTRARRILLSHKARAPRWHSSPPCPIVFISSTPHSLPLALQLVSKSCSLHFNNRRRFLTSLAPTTYDPSLSPPPPSSVMSQQTLPQHFSVLPSLPAKHADFIPYLTSNVSKPMSSLLQPYKEYEAKLREIFAQQPGHPALQDAHVNVVPIYSGHESGLNIRARNLQAETDAEKERYLMPLSDEKRLVNGSSAVVGSLKEFQTNFNLFSESSLVDLNWSNVVAAGSSVVTSLLPVPKKHRVSKRALRQYYHEELAPASDVDLFLYGLTEEEAIEKIKEIETHVKDSILQETTTIRTKNAITIASQYPTRHIQIVLRIYKSVSEILTGFDVDCSCAAYDGTQVYASPRALSAYMTQVNHIDLTRRSPSYENRLSKYSHRGFEVHWPNLERSRIDPTIFERTFSRTAGLARLLVLETLPKASDRESYLDQRRKERGRPEINRYSRFNGKMRGNIKAQHDDEVAEWVEEDEVSDYHTFTIPYGPKFDAKKIEKLLYTKDLLLNAEWNKPESRKVNLHRHPAFFGRVEDIVHDCCGYCPVPKTDEEEVVHKEESKKYVSGDLVFMTDDPGRQSIGSFNPITDEDWTEMAYVGNTARLCQAIVDCDLEHVEDWLSQPGADPNTRDYTGRTPLHLAVTSSTPEVVQCLVDHGARLIARLADGRTALHLASARGNADIVKILLKKSEENEEEEAKKEDLRKQARAEAKRANQAASKSQPADDEMDLEKDGEDDNRSDNSIDMIDAEEGNEDTHSTTTGSFVKVPGGKPGSGEAGVVEDENTEEPDVYDVNLVAWDTKASPLHLAIINGNLEVVTELIKSFGADPLIPIKLLESYDNSPRAAILSLALALRLSLEKSIMMTQALIQLGASAAQGDLNQATAVHYFAGSEKPELFDALFSADKTGVERAINHLTVSGWRWNITVKSALVTAIETRNAEIAQKLINAGAHTNITFDDWLKSAKLKFSEIESSTSQQNEENFKAHTEQAVIAAVETEQPSLVLALIEHGADINTLSPKGWEVIQREWSRNHTKGTTLLDVVQNKLKTLKDYTVEPGGQKAPVPLLDDREYLCGFQEGTFKYWMTKAKVKDAKEQYKNSKEAYDKYTDKKDCRGLEAKKEAIDQLIKDFENLEAELLSRNAQTFTQLYPDIKCVEQDYRRHNYERVDPDPFESEFIFSVHDLTDQRREAYLELFQAAWEGDLERIKSLTLHPWGPEKDQTPLQMSVTTSVRRYSPPLASPFHIAILRGHRDTASAILEIVAAQYQPEKKGREQYRLESDEDAYDDSECSFYDSEISFEPHSEFRILKTILDDNFTVNNIGEIAEKVKSKVRPSDYIQWNCNPFEVVEAESPKPSPKADTLLKYAIYKRDIGLLQYLLDQCDRFISVGQDPDTPARFDASSVFQYAILRGSTEVIGELIKRYGAGIQLDNLVKKSGVKVTEKPKYYQGLSVHGKKRADWAAAARGVHTTNPVEMDPPIVAAIKAGSLESVEWFMGDTSLRLYNEYALAHQDDTRLKHLNQSKDGFENTISKWMDSCNDFLLHGAAMASPVDMAVKLCEYLIKVKPNLLNTISANGHTPLSIAFALHRPSVARVLIAAGADQTTRDNMGNNILHFILTDHKGQASIKVGHIPELLSLIDPRLHSSLLKERSQAGPGGATPLRSWFAANWTRSNGYHSHYRGSPDPNSMSKDHLAVMRVILDFAKPTNNEHLELLNGDGDTLLHCAVREQLPAAVEMMMEYRPDLLFRENATGRTPLEMAEDMYISHCVSNPPSLGDRNKFQSVVNRTPEQFLKDAQPSPAEQIQVICLQQAAKAKERKRRLVGLLEANEVAKRLQTRQQDMIARGRKRNAPDEFDEAEDSDEEGAKRDNKKQAVDVVASWFNSSSPASEPLPEEKEKTSDKMEE